MPSHDLEQRLRDYFQAEVGSDSASRELHAAVLATPETSQAGWRGMRLALLLASALFVGMLAGGALMLGSGLVPAPSTVVSTTPAPTPSATPTATPTATPSLTPGPMPSSTSCEGYEFPVGAVTIRTYAELRDGIVGTWVGCVTTPWVPPYWVTITFRSDGTYSGVAAPGAGEPAFYYGTDQDSPEKTYQIDDLQSDLEGVGHIDIYFWPGDTNRGGLRNIRLMGNQLQFEFFHRDAFGPLLYQLYKVAP